MTTILHKRGTGEPSPDELEVGEIAIDTLTGTLYTKQSDGTVVEIGGADGDIVASLGDLTDVDLTEAPVDGDQLTFDGVQRKWVARHYVEFPSEIPSTVPGEGQWTGETEVIEATGSLGFKINGVDQVSGPATISNGDTISLYWLGDPDSGEHIDCPDGAEISGSIRTEAGATSSYSTVVDKNPDVDFQDIQDVEANKLLNSEIVTVSGTNSYCYFGGSSDSSTFEYKKNTEEWAAVPARVSTYFEAGDDIQLRHTSGDEGETVTSTITLGEKTITWVTTTIVSGVITPTIESPENDAIDISKTPTLIASEYQTLGSTPEHASSDWQVMDENGDVIYESLNNGSDLETHKLGKALEAETLYRCRVRYRASDGRESEWSPIVTFTTTALVPGQKVYNSGNSDWYVPAGCYSLTIVGIGAGGAGFGGETNTGTGVYSGGGGGLQWVNDYPVNPGDKIQLRGGQITFADGKVFKANGASQNNAGFPSGVLDGGQGGGTGQPYSAGVPNHGGCGGGGAAGYTGRGGMGARYWGSMSGSGYQTYDGSPGGGGGSGGGGSAHHDGSCRGGGGGGGSTYLYGQGNNGAGGKKHDGTQPPPSGTQRGGSGSAGMGGAAVGGGGQAAPQYSTGCNSNGSGGGWSYRIVWPGDESRGHFPDPVRDV